jgi:mono/diheme cytochrome c family protein
MRERIAKGIIFLTVCLLTALSFLFARLHNPGVPEPQPGLVEAPPAPAPPPQPLTPDIDPLTSPIIERGRVVYNREGCATCHSIAGAGNPRSPLDGAADRWGPDELEAWTTGAGIAADLLPAGIVRRKQRYQAIDAEDLEVLIAYLSTLRD